MTAFRKIMLALTVLALCVAGANAQVNGTTSTSSFACTAGYGASVPTVRSEGISELVGDILITCSGGTPTTPGAQIPQVNVTVNLNTQVTSRLLGNASGVNASEALLLIDEPANLGSGAYATSGWGPAQAQVLCTTPATGCVSYSGYTAASIGASPAFNGPVMVNAQGGSAGIAANVYQGVVNSDGKSVTFYGVPFMAPGTTGVRTFRITNIRANASAVPAGATSIGSIQALVSEYYVPLGNPQFPIATVTQGLAPSLYASNGTSTTGSTGASLSQCNGTTYFASLLRYHSNFGTAFKTRVVNGQSGTAASQWLPGGQYLGVSESGLILNGSGTTGAPAAIPSANTYAGLADYGTRFQAVFNNVPSGVTVYVSTNNVNANGTSGQVSQATGGNTFAQLVVSSTSPENLLNAAPTLSATGSTTTSALTAINYVAFTPAAGTNSVTAVWEVINSNTSTLQNFDFDVWLQYSANVINNSPAPGAITVSLSYAPLSTTTSASSTATIPRFIDSGAADNKIIATVATCTTSLLFPYITTVTGFDTGIAISNTTADPFGTGNQAGACTINWYGNNNGGTTNTPITASTTATSAAPVIAAGTTWTTVASSTGFAGAGFTGYAIAVCNFQLAHGYAAVTDVGTRGILTAYLALVLGTGTGSRPSSSTTIEQLEN
jgi:hypothetical protein